MKPKIEKNYNQERERIEKDIETAVRLNFLRIDINSVASDSKELPISERRNLLWNVMKNKSHGIEVVKSSNGDKEYFILYGETPFGGTVHIVGTNGFALFWITPKHAILHLSSFGDSVDFEEIRELLEDRLNKAMAKHSLSVSLSVDFSLGDFKGNLDFPIQPQKQELFPD